MYQLPLSPYANATNASAVGPLSYSVRAQASPAPPAPTAAATLHAPICSSLHSLVLHLYLPPPWLVPHILCLSLVPPQTLLTSIIQDPFELCVDDSTRTLFVASHMCVTTAFLLVADRLLELCSCCFACALLLPFELCLKSTPPPPPPTPPTLRALLTGTKPSTLWVSRRTLHLDWYVCACACLSAPSP